MNSLDIYNIPELFNIINDYKIDLENTTKKYNEQMKWLKENSENEEHIPLCDYFNLIDKNGEDIDVEDLIEDAFKDYDYTYDDFWEMKDELEFHGHIYYEEDDNVNLVFSFYSYGIPGLIYVNIID